MTGAVFSILIKAFVFAITIKNVKEMVLNENATLYSHVGKSDLKEIGLLN